MEITCDMCGKPCRGQGTQGRGRNQRPATSTPTPRPTTPFISNRHHGLVPHSVRSAHIHQSARNPRIRHAARPPPGTPASHPPHSCAQNADHLAQTPHIHPISPKWSALWAHPSPTPSDLPRFTNLHATHGYTTLPSPHQMPRPRIRTTHALKTQTTSPKTPHIRSISPKWSALWAHTVQLEARRRRHNGCAYDLHHCGARTLHHRCKQH